jgi:HEAT repeat protein
MSRLTLHFTPWFLLVGLLIAGSTAPAESTSDKDDEQTLHSAGLSSDGAALLAFFHARARTDIDPDHLRLLLRQFAADTNQERSLATAEFLGLGPLAVPTLRRAANDLQHTTVAARARNCLHWLEGPSSSSLPAAAARVLAQRKPDGAAAALLAYLPFTDNPDVLRAVTAALAAVAAPGGKPDPALLRGLADPLAVRRAAAGIALARANPPDQVHAVRKLLHDPAPGVRLRTALALAEAHDAEAIPVLIDLLADLPIEQRHRVEEFLQQLAGEWAPASNFVGEDEIARKIRRDAWAAWWQNVDGKSLLSAVRKRTLTREDRETIRGLLGKLGAEDFATREAASKELFALGRRSLPQLREVAKNRDPEASRQAKQLIERIELEPAHRLPTSAIRLLAVRKPAGSVAALLAYLPNAEDENLSAEVQKSLAALALRDGKPDPDLLHALADPQPVLRSTAAEALAKGGGEEGRNAVRKLLQDTVPEVRLRTALALALMKEPASIPVLIDLLTILPIGEAGQAEDTLYQLAGDTAPDVSPGSEPAERRKCRDAWAAWWKVNAARVDLGRLTAAPRLLGFTLICDPGSNRVFEVGRDGRERWAIDNLRGPVDAVVLPGNHVLIAEYNRRRVTERDFKGTIVWQKQCPGNPTNVQRLRNGNTFIALDSQIIEVDRTGKEVYTINSLPGVHAACRSRKGHIVCLVPNNQCFLVDAAGKQLKSFTCNYGNSNIAGLDLFPSGRILVTQTDRNKVVEFDAEGKTLLELDAPGARTATGLPNGHVLVTSQGNQRVWELDRAGKTVWEYKGSSAIIRARRR